MKKNLPRKTLQSPRLPVSITKKIGKRICQLIPRGECYTGKANPSLFVFEIAERRIRKVEGLPDDLSAGEVTWRNSEELLCVGWDTSPRRLGIKYVANRK